MPVSELGSDDTQTILLATTDDRGANLTVHGASAPPADYQLLPAFTTATVDGATVSWTRLPVSTFTNIFEMIVDLRPGYRMQKITVTSSWVTARNATSLTFDTSAPGYQSAWTIAEPYAQFRLSSVDPATGIDYFTGNQ